jgi:Septum formation initiator
VLALVTCTLVLALAWPTQQFFAQRGEITRLREQTRQQQQRVELWRYQKERWADPVYVKAQARERLHFVMPGEIGYVAIDSPEGGRARTVAVDPPWYRKLWQSTQDASRAREDAGERQRPQPIVDNRER